MYVRGIPQTEAEIAELGDYLRADRATTCLSRFVGKAFAKRFMRAAGTGGWVSIDRAAFAACREAERMALAQLVVDDALEYVDDGQSISVRAPVVSKK